MEWREAFESSVVREAESSPFGWSQIARVVSGVRAQMEMEHKSSY